MSTIVLGRSNWLSSLLLPLLPLTSRSRVVDRVVVCACAVSRHVSTAQVAPAVSLFVAIILDVDVVRCPSSSVVFGPSPFVDVVLPSCLCSSSADRGVCRWPFVPFVVSSLD